MDPNTQATLWVTASFVVFCLIAAKPFRNIVLKGLDERAARIRRELDEAEALHAEARALLSEYQRQSRDGAQMAADLVAQAQAEAERLREKAEADLAASIALRERQAMERIAQAEAAAISDVRRAAADLAIQAARRIIIAKASGPEGDRLIDEAIAEIPARLN